MGATLADILGSAIFVAALALLSVERLPRVRVPRAATALAGGLLMVAVGVVSPRAALAAVDVDTLLLLVGMMALVTALETSGLFTWLSGRVVERAATGRFLFAGTLGISALASALLLNDAVVLLFTPVVVRAARELGLDPVPYLAAVAIGANIGSTATPIGNPQNAYIALASGITFPRFAAVLTPLAVAALAVALLLGLLVYRAELGKRLPGRAHAPPPARIHHPRLLALSLAGLCVALVLFVFQPGPFTLPVAALACGSAVVLLSFPLSRVNSWHLVREIDYGILVFFAGLFVLVRGAHEVGIPQAVAEAVHLLPGPPLVGLAVLAAVLSQLVSNVPAVLLLAPAAAALGEPGWLMLAASSTLAGNATMLGAAANVIVAESARPLGAELPAWRFMKLGLPTAVATLVLAILMVRGP